MEKASVFHGYLEDLVYTPKHMNAHTSMGNGLIGQFEFSWCFRGGIELKDEVVGERENSARWPEKSYFEGEKIGSDC